MREPQHTIMTRQGKAADTAMSDSAWSTSGTLFSAVRRLYTWLLALMARVPSTGTIATTADLVSAGTVDLNATCKASIKTQAASALTDYDPPTKAEMDTALSSAGILRRTVAGKAVTSIATGNLFTITGGPIKLLGFVGLIVTVIETKANATNIQFTPDGGAATDLCATLDITGSAAGKFFTITGTKANAMALSADAGIVVANLASPLVLSPGVIKMTCADTSTGAITWYAVYEPMDPTAAVA